MPIFVDHQLQEQIPCDIFDFPIAFYCDELADLPNRAGPMHWHPYFEIATAQNGVLDYQVGQTHTILEPGDSIFVNPNMLHGIRQVSGIEPDHLPIIIFSGTVIASENSVIIRNTSSRFFRVTLCPVLCSDTIAVCGRMSVNGLTLRIAPCGNSPIVTSWWFSATSATYWKQSIAILILCQNPKHHGYN